MLSSPRCAQCGPAATPGAATLGGTFAAAAVDGVASFADLTVDRAASGYSLQAMVAKRSGATAQSRTMLRIASDRFGFRA